MLVHLLSCLLTLETAGGTKTHGFIRRKHYFREIDSFSQRLIRFCKNITPRFFPSFVLTPDPQFRYLDMPFLYDSIQNEDYDTILTHIHTHTLSRFLCLYEAQPDEINR